jgi:hypothetical protein
MHTMDCCARVARRRYQNGEASWSGYSFLLGSDGAGYPLMTVLDGACTLLRSLRVRGTAP